MQIEGKYNHLKTNLETFDPNGSHASFENTSLYYFETLSSISLDIIFE